LGKIGRTLKIRRTSNGNVGDENLGRLIGLYKTLNIISLSINQTKKTCF
jgi:hypothetical protein